MTIDQDRPGCHVIKTHQQLNDGGFTGPGGSDNGNFLAFFDVGRKVFNNRFVRIITKVYVVKINTAGNLGEIKSGGAFGNLFLFIQKGEDPFSGGRGLLQDIGDIGNLHNWLGKLADILDKGLNIPNA